MNMDFVDGIGIIKQAYRKEAEEKVWEQWNLEHIFMNDDNYISFQDFKNKVLNITSKQDKPKQTAKQIIEIAEKIKKRDQNKSERSE
jgi:hypothetical protein